ncbi:MAG: ThuA domain-containing protein [Verrucomicrobiota bacterium JB025]|nr:ThuA domain-containing protein [Verrucomicrobiota bacterium JB025]
MKALIPSMLVGALALFVVAQKPGGEQAPPGTAEKISATLPEKAYATPKKKRKILVVSKTNGYRHKSIPVGKVMFEVMAKKTGAFDVVISDDLANFEASRLKEFDAVCFLNTTMNVFAPHKNRLKKMSEQEKEEAKVLELRLKDNLMKFVKSGRGFIGIHAATDTCYEWPEYGEMMGGYFSGHPWRAGTDVSVKVEPGREAHPLVAMFEGKNVDFKEEIYQFKEPYDSSKVDMLLRLDTEKSDMKVKGQRKDGDFGIAWTKSWGKGRVFYCSLGHNNHIYWNETIARHYLAGIQWALGDYAVE